MFSCGIQYTYSQWFVAKSGSGTMPSRPSSFFTSSSPLPRLPMTSSVVSSFASPVSGSHWWIVPQPRPTFGSLHGTIGPVAQAPRPM